MKQLLVEYLKAQEQAMHALRVALEECDEGCCGKPRSRTSTRRRSQTSLAQDASDTPAEMIKSPRKQELAETRTAQEAPAPKPQAISTLVEVREVLANLSRSGKSSEVRALLLELGFERLSDVPFTLYGELLARAEAMTHG